MAEKPKLTEQESEDLALRAAGVTVEELAVRRDVSPEEMTAELERLLREQHPEVPPDVALELERLETLTRGVWRAAVKGDVPAAAQASRLVERRTELIERNRPTTPQARLQQEMNALLRRTIGRTTPTEE